jgi:hypothetical protein
MTTVFCAVMVTRLVVLRWFKWAKPKVLPLKV